MKYLWDTNAVIYYLHDLLPEPNAKFFDQICLNGAPCFSVITEIELLSWQSTAKEELEIIQSFIQNSLVLALPFRWSVHYLHTSIPPKSPRQTQVATR